MLVAVPPPVGVIVSDCPWSGGGESGVVPAVRPSAVSVPALVTEAGEVPMK